MRSPIDNIISATPTLSMTLVVADSCLTRRKNPICALIDGSKWRRRCIVCVGSKSRGVWRSSAGLGLGARNTGDTQSRPHALLYAMLVIMIVIEQDFYDGGREHNRNEGRLVALFLILIFRQSVPILFPWFRSNQGGPLSTPPHSLSPNSRALTYLLANEGDSNDRLDFSHPLWYFASSRPNSPVSIDKRRSRTVDKIEATYTGCLTTEFSTLIVCISVFCTLSSGVNQRGR
ncbi:hypothetical protein BV22DRAFT_91729 [Leucogyrophana mollusca]|uniref:Uncharacterized protein n=1 Tax=Leucogyrophana mollusca TaxID=85980 RepID=A0ACB8BWJ1_9AGAM|nr:hypothetical protein BV22DRAFT_91729 [Leucogyrophana mollusca]